MNRRERRGAEVRARRDADPGPSDDKYVLTCTRMAEAMRRFLRDLGKRAASGPGPTSAPQFALPPARDAFVIACLADVAGKVARNAEARVLVDRFCQIGIEIGGEGAEPTIEMVRAVLAFLEYPHEVLPLEHFGQFKVVSTRPLFGNARTTRTVGN